jgi:putative DNA primase/helicase
MSKDTNKLAASAEWYAYQNWKILPCYGINSGKCTCGNSHPEPKDIGKHPAINQWNAAATSDLTKISSWWHSDPDYNVGVYCRPSGFLVIDIDPRSGGVESFEKFQSLVEGALPPTVEALTGQYMNNGKNVRGRHLYYKCSPDEELIGNLNKAGLKGIDIKHNGYVLIAPSRHFTGISYEWVEGKGPHEMEMAEAPEQLLEFIRKRNSRSGTKVGTGDWESIFGDLEFDKKKLDVDKMLGEGLVEGERAVGLYQIACALANKFPIDTEAGKLAVETLMIRFNHEKVKPPMPLEGPNSVTMHTRRAIDFVLKNPKSDFTSEQSWPGLLDWANKSQEESQAKIIKQNSDDYSSPRTELQPMTGVVRPPAVPMYQENDDVAYGEVIANTLHDLPGDVDAVNPQDGGQKGMRSFTDIGNGRRLVDTYEDSIRYTPGIGWFHWDDTYWKPDPEALEIRELAKRIPSLIAKQSTQYADADKQSEAIRWANLSKSIARLRSGIDAANSDPRVTLPVQDWDKDEYLLGVRNGVIDLRTGELLRNRPDLYITKRAPVGYVKGQRNVRWEQFLDFATDGDKEYQDWLQRAAGYSLTGSRRYDVMFLVYGPPGSGKNTFVEAIVKCLGTKEYAWPLDSSILAQNDGRASGQDLYHWAELRGRRLVWVDELPDSERLKENSVKKLTGSSEISARSPGEKPFTFESRAKLWVSTNHRPIITDDAMWRRIRPIPFLKVPENPDPELKEYIFDPEGGLPGVLSWAIEGAIKVLGSGSRDGLGTCRVVSEASDVYRKNEDRIGIFMSEETNENAGVNVQLKTLYTVYRAWSDDRGERPMTQIAFHRRLVEKQYQVEGVGSNAIIRDRSLVPRVIPSGAPMDVDWSIAARFR